MEEASQVEFSMLEQDLGATRHLHELLVEKMKEVDFSKEAPRATVRVLEEAKVPTAPSYPRPGRNVAMGGVSGLMVGIALAFLRAYARSGMVSLALPEDKLPAPVIGRLPLVRDGEVLGDILGGEATDSPQAEAFNALRTNVEAMMKPGANVLLITSPDRGDGKSLCRGRARWVGVEVRRKQREGVRR